MKFVVVVDKMTFLVNAETSSKAIKKVMDEFEKQHVETIEKIVVYHISHELN